MSLIVTASSGKDFVIHPAGVTAARCTRIIDLGTVDGEWKNKPKKSHKIVFGFESAVLMDDDQGEYAGKPFLITTNYTASLSDKANLRKDLESWRGRKFTKPELEGFELKNVLGKACMLNMVHSDPTSDGKTYSNISAIMPLPTGMVMSSAVNGLIYFSLGTNSDGTSAFDQSVYESLSDYYKEKIALSDEYKEVKSAGRRAPPKDNSTGGAGFAEDDDIPF
jgi:hypothetical protein